MSRLLFRPGLRLTDRFKPSGCDDVHLSVSSSLTARLDQITIPTCGPPTEVRFQVLECIPPMAVMVAGFQPGPEDALEKRWVSSSREQRSQSLPAFAVDSAHIGHVPGQIAEFISANCKAWADSCPEPQSVSQLIVAESSKHHGFYETSLQLLLGALLKTGTAYLVGEATLGIAPIDEPGHHLHGKRLLPQPVVAQMDEAMTMVLARLQARVFQLWDRLVLSEEKEDWEACDRVFDGVNAVSAMVKEDQTRHAQDNSAQSRYDDPEFVDRLEKTVQGMRDKLYGFNSCAGTTGRSALAVGGHRGAVLNGYTGHEESDDWDEPGHADVEEEGPTE
ncbi:Uncharacterized protein TCAP_04336 [Tolypocladium capitatum]|uniref:Uncharacterized protein n=1 Tax=Tolypocladium capitatum TaxID=45235 RepID=A0A2K3QDU8_9HYPO|nr:Uncharacterized protein TCAP_04336 [Tolypocladium capitatum]